MKPVAERLIVEFDSVIEKTERGIYIPNTAQERTEIATIIEVGQKSERILTEFKPGQRILVNKGAGVPLPIHPQGKNLTVVGYGDVLVVLDDA